MSISGGLGGTARKAKDASLFDIGRASESLPENYHLHTVTVAVEDEGGLADVQIRVSESLPEASHLYIVTVAVEDEGCV